MYDICSGSSPSFLLGHVFILFLVCVLHAVHLLVLH
jgi:hypothetical protein